MTRLIVALDFDGTCVKHEFPKIGEDIGAVPVLKDLVAAGHKLILNTMRSDREEGGDTEDVSIQDVTGLFLTEAVDWFQEKGVPLYGIQQHPTQMYWTDSPKCYADLIIDDTALGIPLIYPEEGRPYIDWVEVRLMLELKGIL